MPKKTKEINTKKETKKTTTSKKTTTKKVVNKTATKVADKQVNKTAKKKKTTVKKLSTVSEYYDLPYGYNQTVIKLLAQTPKTIFVYWEISENDINNFLNKYGQNFFNDTIPVLSVYNETKNYYFDVKINDFANSWYIDVPDEDCKYKVALKRMFKETSPQQRFVEITSSNEMIIPNGHVLGLPNKVEYINLKTKHRYFKTLSYINDTKNVNDNLYNKYIKKIERFDRFGTDNPSSNFSQM